MDFLVKIEYLIKKEKEKKKSHIKRQGKGLDAYIP